MGPESLRDRKKAEICHTPLEQCWLWLKALQRKTGHHPGSSPEKLHDSSQNGKEAKVFKVIHSLTLRNMRFSSVGLKISNYSCCPRWAARMNVSYHKDCLLYRPYFRDWDRECQPRPRVKVRRRWCQSPWKKKSSVFQFYNFPLNLTLFCDDTWPFPCVFGTGFGLQF